MHTGGEHRECAWVVHGVVGDTSVQQSVACVHLFCSRAICRNHRLNICASRAGDRHSFHPISLMVGIMAHDRYAEHTYTRTPSQETASKNRFKVHQSNTATSTAFIRENFHSSGKERRVSSYTDACKQSRCHACESCRSFLVV